MFASWKVGLTVTGLNLTGPMFAKMQADILKTDVMMANFGTASQTAAAKAAAAQRSVAASSAALRTAIGTSMVIAGAGLLAFVGASVKAAGDLQTAKLGLDIKAGSATAAQKLQLNNLLPQLAHETGILDQTTAAKLIGTVLGSGFTASQVLAKAPGSNDTIADLFAKFSDARFRLTGEAPDVTAGAGAAMAHQFAAYEPAQVGPMLESINKLSTAFHMSLQQLQRQSSYFAPGIVQNKIPWADVVGMMNILGPMGMMAQRGGTGVYQVLQNLTKAPKMTRSLTATSNTGMQQLGIYDANNQNRFMDALGKFDLGGALKKLAQDKDTMTPKAFAAALSAAFPSANAQRTIQALVDPARRAQATKLQLKELGIPDISTIQAEYLDTLQGAFGQLRTDLVSMMSRLITPGVLAAVTKGIQMIDGFVTSLTNLFVNVPWAATATALTLMTTGIGLLGGGLLMLARGPWLLIAEGLGTLSASAFAVPLAIAGAVAAVVGIGLAFNYFRTRPAELGQWVAKIRDFFAYEFIPAINGFGSKVNDAVGRLFKDVGNFILAGPEAWKGGISAYMMKTDSAYAAQHKLDNDHAFLVKMHDATNLSGDLARTAGEYGAGRGRPTLHVPIPPTAPAVGSNAWYLNEVVPSMAAPVPTTGNQYSQLPIVGKLMMDLTGIVVNAFKLDLTPKTVAAVKVDLIPQTVAAIHAGTPLIVGQFTNLMSQIGSTVSLSLANLAKIQAIPAPSLGLPPIGSPGSVIPPNLHRPPAPGPPLRSSLSPVSMTGGSITINAPIEVHTAATDARGTAEHVKKVVVPAVLAELTKAAPFNTSVHQTSHPSLPAKFTA